MGTQKGNGIALPILLALTACTTALPMSEYERQDRLNQLLDRYYATKAYCRSLGLAVVVEENTPERCSPVARRANGGSCPPRLGDRVLGCF
jgi:hypothetical protein